MVAALWACHPIQTEAVTYLTQRTELIMAFFLIANALTLLIELGRHPVLGPACFGPASASDRPL